MNRTKQAKNANQTQADRDQLIRFFVAHRDDPVFLADWIMSAPKCDWP
ncbi:hypothetical protein [Novosphingobium sp.]